MLVGAASDCLGSASKGLELGKVEGSGLSTKTTCSIIRSPHLPAEASGYLLPLRAATRSGALQILGLSALSLYLCRCC